MYYGVSTNPDKFKKRDDNYRDGHGWIYLVWFAISSLSLALLSGGHFEDKNLVIYKLLRMSHVRKVCIVMASTVWHFCLFKYFIQPSEKYPKEYIRLQRTNYQVSLCHAIVTALWAVYELLTHQWAVSTYDFFNMKGGDSFQYLCCFLIGYMLYDMHVVTMYKKTRSWIYVFHHSIAITGSLIGVTGRYPCLINLFYVGELPVIAVDTEMLAAFSGQKRLAQVANTCAIVLWLMFRNTITPFISFRFFFYCQDYHMPRKISFVVLVLIFIMLSVMNLYWLKKIVSRNFSTDDDKKVVSVNSNTKNE